MSLKISIQDLIKPIKFSELKFNDYPKPKTVFLKGKQSVVRFLNNYGLSIVQNQYSYGNEQGLYECAVIKFIEGDKFDLVYDTCITDDVIGFCTEEKVEELLVQVFNL